MQKLKRLAIVLAAIAVIPALVIGGAHWQLHRLETGDVEWSVDDETRGSFRDILVDGDRMIMTTSAQPRVVQLVDLESRESMTFDDQPDAYLTFVGDSGHLLTVAREQNVLYGPDGEAIWERAVDLEQRAVAIDHDGSVTFRQCDGPADKRTCEGFAVDSEGEEMWRAPLDLAASERPGRLSPWDVNDDRIVRLNSVLTVNAAPGRVQQFKNGTAIGPEMAVEKEDPESIQVRDLTVGISYEGDQCRFEAVRDGEAAWQSDADCSAASSLESAGVVVHEERAFVTHAASDGVAVVSLDLTTGEANTFTVDFPDKQSEDDRVEYAYTPRAIMAHVGDSLTAFSPLTGKKMWDRTVTESVQFTPDSVAVLDDTPGWLSAAVGRDVPIHTSQFYDIESGEETASVAAKYQYGVYSAGADQIFLIADDQLKKVAS